MKAPAAPLEKYRARRNFQRTPEPPAVVAQPATRLSYVVQRHAARRLHYDLRLEWKGVLKSWAVTRGPSLDPADKRLAVEVEDHPVAYGAFEGRIPPPDYGAGIVQLWDRGLWAPLHPERVEADLAKGELKFVLSGERLKGGFVLIRLKPRKGERPGVHNWLLIKERDSMARPGEGDAVLRAETSVHSGLTMEEIGQGRSAIRYLPDFTAPGGAVLASACQLHMEGIVSKRRDAPYVSGRDGDWVKAKCRGREEFVVGGWSPQASGHGLGALLLGTHRDGRFTYVGRVGTGFNQRTAPALLQRLSTLAIAKSPFIGKQPAVTRGVTWTKPELVVEVAYGGWTEEGILRHASFQGIREDKPARDVAPEPVKAPPVSRNRPGMPTLTHPERVLWPATATTPALTKADLAAHYARFADRILEHVAGRPLSILRAPEGIEGELFFQRHAMRGQSPLIGSVVIEGQSRPYMRIEDAAGLAALAQISAVELHPWGSRPDQPEAAERLVFDLDPAPDLPFDAVVKAALELRRRLTALGLTAFPRVTGGKGLHLVVPLAAEAEAPGWEMVKSFARLVCAVMEQDAPARYTTKLSKRTREGRIFLDYLRNDRLATAIANFSPRARAGAPVCFPVSWAMVKPGLDPAGFHLPALAAKPLPRDPWRGFAAAASPVTQAMQRLTQG